MNELERHGRKLAEGQIRYYRRWRGYPEWILGYMADVAPECVRILKLLDVRGRILEPACGDGMWTQVLAGLADTVTAVDSSPSMLDLLQQRRLPRVETVLADLFDWVPPANAFDVLFMCHWWAHVPLGLVDTHWRTVTRALVAGGRVVIIDVTPEERDAVTSMAQIQRELVVSEDGTECARRVIPGSGEEHLIPKHHWRPADLVARLSTLGWDVVAIPVAVTGRGFAVYVARRRSDERR